MDRRHLLKIQKYEMCDAISASDHRPVTAAIELLVKTWPPRNIGDSTLLPRLAAESNRRLPPLPENTQLLKIRLYDLEILWGDSAPALREPDEAPALGPSNSASQPQDFPEPESFRNLNSTLRSSSYLSNSCVRSGSYIGNSFVSGSFVGGSYLGSDSCAEPEKCTIYFPLENEDPLSSLRQPVLLSQALTSRASKGRKLMTSRNMQNNHSFTLGEEEGQVLELRSLVCSDSSRSVEQSY